MLCELFDVILKRKKVKGMLDWHIYKWNSYPAQHCMRFHQIDKYPRLLFTSGASSMTNLKADDKVGIMFCVVVASLQLAEKTLS